MRTVDIYGNDIENPDLTKGQLTKRKIVKKDAVPVDDITKFHYEDDDFETVMMYFEYAEGELESIKAGEKEGKRLAQLNTAVSLFVQTANFDNATALTVSELYPEWKVGEKYKISDIRRYNDELYRCLLDNTAAAEHTPDIAIGLWKKILPAEEPGGYLPWVQPVGATDAYKKGDRVTHKDKTWESTVDNNVWEPGVYGWIEVQE